MKRLTVVVAALACTLLALPRPAHAIPAFARKYGTSCETCHTVYPKLTPFGEAFRRNGFRFPGVDSDYVKQDTVTTEAKTGKSEGSWIPAIPSLAFGFNGQMVIHPDKNSTQAQADHGALVNLADFPEEGHIWAGGTFNDKTSYFGEVTFANDGTIDIEHAQIYFNDIAGPQHALNVRVGRGFSNVSSFGPHSSFLADALMPPSGVAQMNGAASGGFNMGDQANGVEASGVLAGRVDYNVGWNSGSQIDVRSAEDAYAHVGVKLGGMRLDGEGQSATNPARPWEETALTLDAFAYHALAGVDYGTGTTVQDTVNTFGGDLRAQWGSLELDSGAYLENHKRAEPGLTGATFLAQYNELSYMVTSWFVPAVRFEYNKLTPDSGCVGADGSACPEATDWRLMPGIAMIPYPNVKVVLTALFESGENAPLSGDWSPAGGGYVIDPTATPLTASRSLEFQNVQIYTAFAF